MKSLLLSLFLFLVVFPSAVQAQKSYKITYLSSDHGKTDRDQDPIVLLVNDEMVKGTSIKKLAGKADYPYQEFYINWKTEPAEYIRTAHFSADKSLETIDTNFLGRYEYKLTDETKKILGYTCYKAVTIVNSNNIELWYTKDLPYKASPVGMGQELGVVLEYVRNGNTAITASEIKKVKLDISMPQMEVVDALSYNDALWKSSFIQIPVFENEQINFVDNPKTTDDGVLRFASGTVILKKVKIPELKPGTQGFVQAIQKSLGDAYDRTASIFLIRKSDKETFLHGMQKGMDSIETYENGNGTLYKGMVASEIFEPSIELMRFFTPFGVDHFNDRVKLKGKEWLHEVIYRQDISEFVDALSGQEVYIGGFIGNWDKGGHDLSLELTFHPGWETKVPKTQILPLFNTTSVMEMGGQGYPTMFDTEKGLKVNFELKEAAKNVQLRYITTGHGGWSGGDEFNQKPNSIYLDGKQISSFIPWRTDCGSYRLYNPVSGNFENGLSSSDLSRSNWCPATITPPEYIDLGDLPAGKHIIEVNIPQGASEGNSFSYWNVSGVLLYNSLH
ncbi:GLPGLI family protein [Aequorivita sp. H23M31]|uniref:GLPGLI family protein n=1 Tax=Aequorivita ciconiae TaxID=2494375 RepID=A0A410G1H7_9FLAO|nr:GLPGLI family protein [Aequorivita sp. H23M31]QAA81123.1 GLPGLI family protein [Aequorivita sp. H23M31]